MSSATWQPSTGQWGIFGTASGSEARARHDKYGTHDRGMQRIIDQSKGVVSDAYSGMETQMFEMFGGDDPSTPEIENSTGILDQKYGFKLDQMSLQTGNQLNQIGTQADTVAAKTGFASDTMADIQEQTAMQNIYRGHSASVGATIMDKRKEKSDFTAKMRNDWNNLLMSYQQATGDAWKGDEDMDDLFNEYT